MPSIAKTAYDAMKKFALSVVCAFITPKKRKRRPGKMSVGIVNIGTRANSVTAALKCTHISFTWHLPSKPERLLPGWSAGPLARENHTPAAPVRAQQHQPWQYRGYSVHCRALLSPHQPVPVAHRR